MAARQLVDVDCDADGTEALGGGGGGISGTGGFPTTYRFVCERTYEKHLEASIKKIKISNN